MIFEPIHQLYDYFVRRWVSRILWVFGVILPSDLWSLDQHLAEFIAPRLEKFSLDQNKGIPGSIVKEYESENVAADAWSYRLWLMVYAMRVYEDGEWNATHDDLVKAKIGLEFFGRHFPDLWT